jgi:pyridoxamine 5'-phosphate oxidase
MISRFERRDDYRGAPLLERDAAGDPLDQFDRWMGEALAAGIAEANAAALSTADAAGRPSSRMVLLKDYGALGFVFAMNYRSRKAQELAANPHAALLFWWPGLSRQIRAEGRIERAEAAVSDAIFAERPRGAQLGAWASPQSSTVADREVIARAFREADARYRRAVPRPEHWGAFRLLPEAVEFWQGQPDRLHDRLRYRLEGQRWRLERLAP